MNKRRWIARFPRVFVVLAVVLGAGLHAAEPAGAATGILGGGSGFAALEIDQWRADTARSPYNLNVNYVAQGSSFGRQQFNGGSFDYGVSDIEYVQLEIPDIQRGRCAGKTLANCFVYVPVSAGGLAFMYNLTDSSGHRITDLKLTRSAACKIFTGAITKWNNPEIVATNPRLAAINRDIRPVIRADGAGESYVFSEFCIAVAGPAWQAFVTQQRGSGNAVNLTPEFISGQPTSVWPQEAWGTNPTPVPYADGTANYVADPVGGTNAITYVAAGYAKVRNFPTASLQNAAGAFTQPDEENVTVALGYASPRGNGTFQLAFNGPDARAYFPSTYSYALAQTSGFNPSKGETLGRFLCYAVSQGQVIAPQLRYARLSKALVDIAIDAIVRIPGAPAKANCFIGNAKPPEQPTCVGCVPVGPGGGLGPGGGGGGLTPGGGTNPGASGGPRGSGGATTTTTTVPPAALAAEKAAAQQAAATEAATEDLTKKLAEAAASRPDEGGTPSVIWLLVLGAGVAWITTLVLGRRRAKT